MISKSKEEALNAETSQWKPVWEPSGTTPGERSVFTWTTRSLAEEGKGRREKKN